MSAFRGTLVEQSIKANFIHWQQIFQKQILRIEKNMHQQSLPYPARADADYQMFPTYECVPYINHDICGKNESVVFALYK